MTSQSEKATRFLALHHGDDPLLLPNPWDAGSAKVLASLGFEALATTSAGFAATLGRLDGRVTRDEALAHARAIVAATDLPVSADYENAFAHDPVEVAESISLAVDTGLAGCSIEDFTGDPSPVDAIYPFDLAVARVTAAADAAHSGPVHLVVTARCESFLHGRPDLDDTIARLRAYQDAGADVVYAPGVTDPAALRTLVESVEVPVNVLALPGAPSVAELAAIGVRRISVGSGFSSVALGALVEAGRELLEHGTYGYWSTALVGVAAGRAAFNA